MTKQAIFGLWGAAVAILVTQLALGPAYAQAVRHQKQGVSSVQAKTTAMSSTINGQEAFADLVDVFLQYSRKFSIYHDPDQTLTVDGVDYPTPGSNYFTSQNLEFDDFDRDVVQRLEDIQAGVQSKPTFANAKEDFKAFLTDIRSGGELETWRRVFTPFETTPSERITMNCQHYLTMIHAQKFKWNKTYKPKAYQVIRRGRKHEVESAQDLIQNVQVCLNVSARRILKRDFPIPTVDGSEQPLSAFLVPGEFIVTEVQDGREVFLGTCDPLKRHEMDQRILPLRMKRMRLMASLKSGGDTAAIPMANGQSQTQKTLAEIQVLDRKIADIRAEYGQNCPLANIDAENQKLGGFWDGFMEGLKDQYGEQVVIGFFAQMGVNLLAGAALAILIGTNPVLLVVGLALVAFFVAKHGLTAYRAWRNGDTHEVGRSVAKMIGTVVEAVFTWRILRGLLKIPAVARGFRFLRGSVQTTVSSGRDILTRALRYPSASKGAPHVDPKVTQSFRQNPNDAIFSGGGQYKGAGNFENLKPARGGKGRGNHETYDPEAAVWNQLNGGSGSGGSGGSGTTAVSPKVSHAPAAQANPKVSAKQPRAKTPSASKPRAGSDGAVNAAWGGAATASNATSNEWPSPEEAFAATDPLTEGNPIPEEYQNPHDGKTTDQLIQEALNHGFILSPLHLQALRSCTDHSSLCIAARELLEAYRLSAIEHAYSDYAMPPHVTEAIEAYINAQREKNAARQKAWQIILADSSSDVTKLLRAESRVPDAVLEQITKNLTNRSSAIRFYAFRALLNLYVTQKLTKATFLEHMDANQMVADAVDLIVLTDPEQGNIVLQTLYMAQDQDLRLFDDAMLKEGLMPGQVLLAHELMRQALIENIRPKFDEVHEFLMAIAQGVTRSLPFLSNVPSHIRDRATKYIQAFGDEEAQSALNQGPEEPVEAIVDVQDPASGQERKKRGRRKYTEARKVELIMETLMAAEEMLMHQKVFKLKSWLEFSEHKDEISYPVLMRFIGDVISDFYEKNPPEPTAPMTPSRFLKNLDMVRVMMKWLLSNQNADVPPLAGAIEPEAVENAPETTGAAPVDRSARYEEAFMEGQVIAEVAYVEYLSDLIESFPEDQDEISALRTSVLSAIEEEGIANLSIAEQVKRWLSDHRQDISEGGIESFVQDVQVSEGSIEPNGLKLLTWMYHQLTTRSDEPDVLAWVTEALERGTVSAASGELRNRIVRLINGMSSEHFTRSEKPYDSMLRHFALGVTKWGVEFDPETLNLNRPGIRYLVQELGKTYWMVAKGSGKTICFAVTPMQIKTYAQVYAANAYGALQSARLSMGGVHSAEPGNRTLPQHEFHLDMRDSGSTGQAIAQGTLQRWQEENGWIQPWPSTQYRQTHGQRLTFSLFGARHVSALASRVDLPEWEDILAWLETMITNTGIVPSRDITNSPSQEMFDANVEGMLELLVQRDPKAKVKLIRRDYRLSNGLHPHRIEIQSNVISAAEIDAFLDFVGLRYQDGHRSGGAGGVLVFLPQTREAERRERDSGSLVQQDSKIKTLVVEVLAAFASVRNLLAATGDRQGFVDAFNRFLETLSPTQLGALLMAAYAPDAGTTFGISVDTTESARWFFGKLYELSGFDDLEHLGKVRQIRRLTLSKDAISALQPGVAENAIGSKYQLTILDKFLAALGNMVLRQSIGTRGSVRLAGPGLGNVRRAHLDRGHRMIWFSFEGYSHVHVEEVRSAEGTSYYNTKGNRRLKDKYDKLNQEYGYEQ